MLTDDELKDRLDSAFAHYHESILLMDDLIKQEREPQDIVLLACARLDSLANLAYPNKTSQQEAFCQFISNYSGQKRFFNAVSVGNLYSDLVYYGYIADGLLVDIPGRIKRFGLDSDYFLSFIERTNVPITGKSVGRIANRIAQILQHNFNVKKKTVII
jgi:hypothetical protein